MSDFEYKAVPADGLALEALLHVREHYPRVSMVAYTPDQLWIYSDGGDYIPEFDDRIDITLLENALDETFFKYGFPAYLIATDS